MAAMNRSGHDHRQDDPLEEPSGIGGDSGTPDESGGIQGKLMRILGATPVMMMLALLLLAALATLAWYATQWKQRVTVSKVLVTDTALLDAAVLEKRLDVFRGRQLDSVLIDDVRRTLVSERYIRAMRISKELNGILRVRIDERRPAALMIAADRRMIIDTEGCILPDGGVSRHFRRLVSVYGGIPEPMAGNAVPRLRVADRALLFSLLHALEESAHAGLMVSEIHLAPDNATWISVTGSPIRFIIGNDGNFKEKLKKFEIFWQKVVAKKGIDCYESADLRFRSRVFTRDPEPLPVPPLPLAPAVPPGSPQHSDEHQ
jgi:cell division protein FtsQ